MKAIKDLTVKVTYTVGLSDVEVPENVYGALMEYCDNGGKIFADAHAVANDIASEWILDNIHESDAMDWECEIDDIVEQ
ncbi:hypothetical protein [Bacteroides heparinolyticus]|uniref:hypothetical protein n=1 Tax=Prevotella heparinolytica TaxID=28113 RepID=UPI003AF0FEC0